MSHAANTHAAPEVIAMARCSWRRRSWTILPTLRKIRLGPLAVSLLPGGCLFWGLKQVLIKATIRETPPSIADQVSEIRLAAVCVSSLRCGQPAVLSPAGAPLQLAFGSINRGSLIRWDFRSAAQTEGTLAVGIGFGVKASANPILQTAGRLVFVYFLLAKQSHRRRCLVPLDNPCKENRGATKKSANPRSKKNAVYSAAACVTDQRARSQFDP